MEVGMGLDGVEWVEGGLRLPVNTFDCAEWHINSHENPPNAPQITLPVQAYCLIKTSIVILFLYIHFTRSEFDYS